MTHFTVGIIIPNSVLPTEIDAHVFDLMEPYDESREVAPYVSYSLDRAREDLDREIRRFERIIERLDPDFDIDKCKEKLSALRSTTPDAKYQEYVEHHEHFDSRGEPLSTYNPDSKWDWFVVGGRWDGWINDRSTDNESMADNIASTADVLNRGKIPHALVTPDGEWHEAGQMGWWGVMVTENEGWDAKAILSQYPDCYVLLLDAHI